jgi:hypothetical protein
VTAPADVQQASREFMAAANQLSTLVEIEADSTALWLLLHQVEDDTWTPEERAELEQRLQQANAQLLTKIESYAGLIRKLETLADNDDAEMSRIKARRDRKKRSAEWLRQNLLEHLKRTGQERIETSRFTVSLRTNPPAVQVLEALAVPGEYLREKIEITVDKRAIIDHYKKTGEIPAGCDVTRGQRVDIS